MTINERIKMLRKDNNWNQKQLASMLGLTQSGVSYMEQLGSTVSESSIKTLCSVCNVNEEWLRTGSGSMYVEPDAFSLDDFMKSRDASDIELEIVKAYFEIDAETRKKLIQHFKERILYQPQHPDTPEELEKQFPPVEDAGSQAG